MRIEKKCENCIFYDENYSPFNIVCNDCKEIQKEDNCFYPKEEVIRQDERKQALLDIAMELEKDRIILEGNYKNSRFGFQKGYWQGQLEYAWVLKNNLIDKANRKEL